MNVTEKIAEALHREWCGPECVSDDCPKRLDQSERAAVVGRPGGRPMTLAWPWQRKRAPKPYVLTITIDTRPFVRAMQNAIDAMNQLLRAFNPEHRRTLALAGRRRARGGSGNPLTADWQSSPCAAWLHASCPTDDLDCHCTCHGGHLR